MSYADRISKQISRIGELVDIEDYSSKTYSDYGDLVTQTTSTTTSIRAVFNQYGKSAGFQTEGVFEEGDCSFFFKGDQTGIENDNIVVRTDDTRWKITQVAPHYCKGSKTHIEARVNQE